MPSKMRQAIIDSMVEPSRRPNDTQCSALFRFAPDFPGFQGHFPGDPVLPGVVQLLMGAVASGCGRELHIGSVSRAKFTRLVRPGENILVQCSLMNKEGALQAAVTISVCNATAAQFSLQLHPQERSRT